MYSIELLVMDVLADCTQHWESHEEEYATLPEARTVAEQLARKPENIRVEIGYTSSDGYGTIEMVWTDGTLVYERNEK
jgi:hypothetical protein